MRPAILVTLAVIGAAGCGTMIGNVGGMSPDHYMDIYGGVQIDLESAAKHFNQSPSDVREGLEQACGTACVLVDLPLSVVADTLTLPFTIDATLRGKAVPHVAQPAPIAARPGNANEDVAAKQGQPTK